MILSGDNLSKSYGSGKVLDNVSIACSSGEVHGLLGSNGAGKSTLFKILTGLVKPDAGTVNINSTRVKPIGAIIEKPALYDYLSAYENLKIFSIVQGDYVKQKSIQESLFKVGLPLDRKDPVRNFSLGMKQRLGIAIALLNDPECLVLDEPFSGLDPIGIAALRKLILKLAEEEKLAILISSHIVEELSKICSMLFVIKDGKIVNSGPTHILIAENTSNYIICASNIESSMAIKEYEVVFKGKSALVAINPEEIPGLLQKLYNENVFITSCTPEISMEKLFQTTTK
jgi:ABC-2 type transport system ATP-binding protein